MGFDLNNIKQADRTEILKTKIPLEGNDGTQLTLEVSYRPLRPNMADTDEPAKILAKIVSQLRLLDKEGQDLGLEFNGKPAEPTEEFFADQRTDFLTLIVEAVAGDYAP